MTATSKQIPESEPEELEALLPWHATGTLNTRDARRVDEALARDPVLAKQYAVIQDEYAATIHLNESLGAPSARAMQKLFAAIDAEPARKPSMAQSLSTRISAFFASLTPRTLAYSASAAALLVLLQAGVLSSVLLQDRDTGPFVIASDQGGTTRGLDDGVKALVRFAPDAKVSDINTLLGKYKASIIGGPKAGTYVVRIGDGFLPKDEVTRLMTQIQSEKIVGFVAVAQQ
jgi:anti-sigma factor RsiW